MAGLRIQKPTGGAVIIGPIVKIEAGLGAAADKVVNVTIKTEQYNRETRKNEDTYVRVAVWNFYKDRLNKLGLKAGDNIMLVCSEREGNLQVFSSTTGDDVVPYNGYITWPIEGNDKASLQGIAYGRVKAGTGKSGKPYAYITVQGYDAEAKEKTYKRIFINPLPSLAKVWDKIVKEGATIAVSGFATENPAVVGDEVAINYNIAVSDIKVLNWPPKGEAAKA